jgi:hypothetical protein
MLIPDYLAIGTLVILILGAAARVYSEKRGVSLSGWAVTFLGRAPYSAHTAPNRVQKNT